MSTPKQQLEELRKLVRKSLREFNTNAAGGAGHPIHAFAVPNQHGPVDSPAEVPPDPADIANAIVVAIKNLVQPVQPDEEGQTALALEVDRSRKILADWVKYPEALEAAALQAAETLLTELDFTGISHSKDAGTLAY